MTSKSGKTKYFGIESKDGKQIKVQSRTKALDIIKYIHKDARLELTTRPKSRCFRLSIDGYDCGRISKSDFKLLQTLTKGNNNNVEPTETRITQSSNQITGEQCNQAIQCDILDQTSQPCNKIQPYTIHSRDTSSSHSLSIERVVLPTENIIIQLERLGEIRDRARERGDSITERSCNALGAIAIFQGMSRGERYNYLKAKRDAYLASKA